jgi:hypothetical protein
MKKLMDFWDASRESIDDDLIVRYSGDAENVIACGQIRYSNGIKLIMPDSSWRPTLEQMREKKWMIDPKKTADIFVWVTNEGDKASF